MTLGLTQQGYHLPQLTILPQLRDKLVSGQVEQCCYVIIQGVHVLHQPLVGLVVHLRRDMRQAALGNFLRLLPVGNY